MEQFACIFIPSESYKHLFNTYCMLATLLSVGNTMETIPRTSSLRRKRLVQKLPIGSGLHQGV